MILTYKDMHTPFNSVTLKKILAVLQQGRSEQAVAATAAGAALVNGTPALYAGNIKSIFVISAAVAGVAETMTYDVLVNGASVLTAPYVFSITSTAKAQVDLPLDPTKVAIATGDIITVSRTYVAGGAPTMTANTVVVAWA
jgi:hypothetical protein